MPSPLLIAVLLTTYSFAQSSGTPQLPRFEDYAVKSMYEGPLGKPRFPKDWSKPAMSRFREAVALASERGPNFAGRFTLVSHSCGTGCIWMSVVDAQTGKVFGAMPFGTLDTQKGEGNNYEGLRYHLNSSLLIVEGCLNVDARMQEGKAPECSRGYYNWHASKFRLLHRLPLEMPKWLKEYLNQ